MTTLGPAVSGAAGKGCQHHHLSALPDGQKALLPKLVSLLSILGVRCDRPYRVLFVGQRRKPVIPAAVSSA
jgi:hypothetical protein